MLYMLCRNRVRDFATWKAVLSSHAQAHRAAGLRLAKLWRSMEDQNNVFFLFEVESIERARHFINNPASAEAGIASGVVEGEYHFVEDAGSY